MRELRVEDALLYLDQVKVEFGDRPHIYNEFLDIMKTFKTQQIDTPGVIRRVSTLFQGNRRLVLGFNTFLPEGYKIELPLDGDGPPVAVFRAPGSNVAHVLHSAGPLPAQGPAPAPSAQMQQMMAAQQQQQQPPPQQQQPGPPRAGMPPIHGASSPMLHQGAPQQQQQQHAMSQQQQQQQQQHAMGQQMQQQQQQHPNQGMNQQPQQQQQQPMIAARASNQSPLQQQQQQAGQAPQMQDGKVPAQAGGMQPMQQQQQQSAAVPGQSPPAAAGAAQQQSDQQQQGGAPLEFDHAINYVTTIKKRFASEPETYKKFLEILHTYQKEQRGIKEVLDEVSVLFADHPDLLKEFTYFLPDAVQAQAKEQLDAVAKESEARKRAQARQAIMDQAGRMQRQRMPSSNAHVPFDRHAIQIPFGATQGRTMDQERELMQSAEYGEVSFSPVRPPRSKELTPAQAAVKEGRPLVIPESPVMPNTTETIFFQRAKAHLSRKELSSDKTPNQRRHTPYVEFLKCLHLFGSGILNKEELILLLRGLFTQGHAPKGVTGHNPHVSSDAAELLRDFEEILVGRGPYAEQQNTLKDKSKYGSLRMRDVDFTGCDNPTPSYRSYPSDYPKSLFLSHPDQTDEETAILNKKYVCVGRVEGTKMTDSLEAFDSIRVRHNAYEDTMARIEDERYDFDMAIERNAQAMRQIEPLAEEAQGLRLREEKDGQPIGRLQYKLKQNTMNSIIINAIGRLYGDRGDEILQHLLRNPLIVLPIVYQRLKQKDAEWRKAKADNMERWNAATEANYEGSLDVLCHFQRRDVERTFTASHLLEQCKKAKTYIRHPEMLRDKPAARDFSPTFGTGCPDPSAVFFEPRLSVPCTVDASHRDAFQLVAHRLKNTSNVTAIDRERIGRIWAEFVLPWFKYPPHWIMDEVRDSFSGRLTPAVVRFAPGQRVRTIYGDGVVTSFMESKQEYRVKLSFGTGHLKPYAVLHPLAVKETPYVRRDGAMVREYDAPVDAGGSEDHKLGAKYQLLYGTERVYLFMRLYVLLTNLLADIRNHCETFPMTQDPADSYQNRSRKPVKRKLSDFSGVLALLKQLLADECDVKEFESLGRKVSKEKVYVMAALPKLVNRCVESLVSVAKEDVLLHLYDYCQYREVDPSVLRKQCFAMAPDADFRIQFDGEKSLSFSHLPKSMEFPTAPPSPPADEIMEHADANADEDEPPMNGGRQRSREESEAQADDPIEEFVDGEPRNKKPRVK